MVGLARMYDNKHWASDVALGAAVGTLSGISVVHYDQTHPRNRVERWMGVAMAPTIMPSAQGVIVAWHVTPKE
jgi:membrane-associated phospholipid phosphatase